MHEWSALRDELEEVVSPVPVEAWSLERAMALDSDHVRSQTSDENGDFAFPELEPGTWRLTVRAPGHAPFDLDSIWLAADETRDLGRVSLRPSVVLMGIVVDANGDSVSGAELFVEEDALHAPSEVFVAVQTRRVAQTDELGEFRIDQLEPGDWSLRVVTAQHPEARIEGRTELQDSPVSDLRIQLGRGCEVTGWVRSDEPEAVFVHALPQSLVRNVVEFEEASESVVPNTWLAGARRATVSADGRFRLEGLECGEIYALRALSTEAPDAIDVWARASWVLAGATDVEIEHNAGATLAFQVVDRSTGDPVEKYVAWLEGAEPLMLRGDDAEPLRHHAEGRVRWSGVRPEQGVMTSPDKLPDGGPLTLRIRADGYDVRTLEQLFCFSGQYLDLGRVALDPLPSLRVEVVEAASGEPLARCSVVLQPDGGGVTGRRYSRAATDADGAASVTSLPSARALLSITKPGYAPHTSIVSSVMAPEDPPLRVELDRGGQVSLSVVDDRGLPAPVANVYRIYRGASLPGFASPHQLVPRAVMLDEQGRAELHSLEPGVHGFVALPAPSIGEVHLPRVVDIDSWTHVTVYAEAPAPLELRVGRTGTLAGEIWYGDRPLSDARLRLVPGTSGFLDAIEPDGGWERTLRANASSVGRFEFEHLSEGAYTLEIRSQELDIATRRVVRFVLNDPPTFIDIKDTGMQGVVRGPNGEAASGAEIIVWASPFDDSKVDAFTRLEQLPWVETLARTRATEGGTFEVLGLPPGTQCDVWARWQGSSGAVIQVEVQQGRIDGPVEVQLVHEAQLEVEVAGYERSEPLVVVAFERQTLVTAELRFQGGPVGLLDSMTPGGWFVQAYAIGVNGRLLPVGERRFVELGEGESARVSLESAR